jgi:hypothetical protein
VAQIQHKDQGDIWTPQATFTVAGTPTDPTNITVRIKKPDGTVTVLGPVAGGTGGGGITRVSAGVFKTDITLDDAGYWFARFEGTGTAAAAEDHQAIVDPSEFYETAQLGTRALVGMAEARDWLQHTQQEAPDGLELARVINDVSDRIHYEAAREFKAAGTNPAIRLFPIENMSSPDPWYVDGQYMGDRNIWSRTVNVGDLASAPTLVRILDTDWTTSLETVAAGDMTLHPVNREAWEPIQAIELHSDVTSLSPGMRLEVTGTWGFPAVPGNIRQAALDAIAAVLDRDVESYSTDLAPMQAQGEGTNVIIMGRSPRLLSLPPAALAVAWSYRPRYIA